MGFMWRVLAPKPAKTVKRAVTRPAKTARQFMTPTPVQRTASRAWRAADPRTGVRQEAQAAGVSAARKRLYRPAGAATERPAPRPEPPKAERSKPRTPQEAAIEKMRQSGWAPGSTHLRQVPVLGQSTSFLLIEDERRHALEVINTTDDVLDALESLLILDHLYTTQIAAVRQAVTGACRLEDLSDSEAQFCSWASEWLAITLEEHDRWRRELHAVAKSAGRNTRDAAARRAEPRWDDIGRRIHTSDAADRAVSPRESVSGRVG